MDAFVHAWAFGNGVIFIVATIDTQRVSTVHLLPETPLGVGNTTIAVQDLTQDCYERKTYVYSGLRIARRS